jgi:hypothetical protein
MKTSIFKYLLTFLVVAVAAATGWLLYRKYVSDPGPATLRCARTLSVLRRA